MTESQPVSFRLSATARADLEHLVRLDDERAQRRGYGRDEHPLIRQSRSRRLLLEDAIYFLLKQYEDDMNIPDNERQTSTTFNPLDDQK
jgi:hypothetical protein